MQTLFVKDTNLEKIIRGQTYNSNFCKADGFFVRWGTTQDDDPQLCPIGPEIADIELSFVCEETELDKYRNNPNLIITEGGCNGIGCTNFCYKQNGGGKYTVHMSLHGFKQIIDKMPKSLNQIAFGLCSTNSHPELCDIFAECRKRGIVPNFTSNGVNITEDIAAQTAKLCGAVAVSVNQRNKHHAYHAIELFNRASSSLQVNIHYVLSEQTYQGAFDIIKDIQVDERLKNFHGAIVLLGFKDKANIGNMSAILDIDKYAALIDYAHNNKVKIGFDSCSAGTYLKIIKGKPNEEKLAQMCEPCESMLFSIYINALGQVFACSFLENIGPHWNNGIDIYQVKDFAQDVWYSEQSQQWRNCLLKCGRNCPHYQI